DVGVLGSPSAAVSWRPHGRSWNSHGIVKLDGVRIGRLPEGRWQWLAEILVEFHHSLDGIVHMQQGFIYGITFGHEFRQERTRHRIAAFRLTGEDQWDFIDRHQISHSIEVLCYRHVRSALAMAAKCLSLMPYDHGVWH